ncbi:flavin reductase family protein [Enterococcus sp. AZ126]|uniref:flavin reductase family protein n=1 Tax=Enterococcus sp. AZ126 TaxID=2774635 RepID=UPI003F233100
MLHYPTKDLSSKQAYKFLSGSIIPRPIAWVTTLSKECKTVNAAPFSFFNAAASEIPLVTLSILRRDGEIKDTARNILDTQELVIHLVNDQVVQSMNQTAASLAHDQSEIILNKIDTTSSKSVKVPGITAAPIRMEARLHQYVPVKNHDDQIITDLFIVEITDFYFDDNLFDQEKEYVLSEVFKPIARLAGNTYAHIDGLFDLIRPD